MKLGIGPQSIWSGFIAVLIILSAAAQAVADPPVLATNIQIEVFEEEIAVIDQGHLEVIDPDTPADQIIFTVTDGVLWGQIQVNGQWASTFTQADIDLGLVIYQAYFEPGDIYFVRFVFDYSDGTTTVPGSVFTFLVIPVDDPPVQMFTRTLVVDRDCGMARLSGYELKAQDIDSDPGSIQYFVMDTGHYGELLFDGHPLSGMDIISLQDVYDGHITYSFSGGPETSDSVSFELINAVTPSFPYVDIEISGTPSNIIDTSSPSMELFLDRVHPNPFNPETEINFEGPVGSHLKLCVFDSRGCKVATLFEGPAKGGIQSVNWRANGLASGIYHLRLFGNGGESTRKVTLLK